MSAPDLGNVMLALYRLEVNCGLQSFWDGGWEVWIGDDMNGRAASESFEPESRQPQVRELMAAWLVAAATGAYPQVREALTAALSSATGSEPASTGMNPDLPTPQAEIERLRGALRPFKDAADHADSTPPDQGMGAWPRKDTYRIAVTLGQCRAARQALSDEGRETGEFERPELPCGDPIKGRASAQQETVPGIEL